MSLQRPDDPYGPNDPDGRSDPRSRAARDAGQPAVAAPGGIDAPLATEVLPDDDPRVESVHVVSGRVGTWDEADAVRRTLLAEGFAPNDIEAFYTGPAGRHAVTGIGGDTHADAGSTHIATGAVTGGVTGAAAGLAVGAAIAAAPVVGPVLLTAAALGAFGGSLIGGVAASEDGSTKPDTSEHPVAKPGGVVIAIRTDRTREGERIALRALEDAGAITLERARARWLDGRWIDWSPVAPREQLAPQPGTPQAGTPRS